MFAFIAKEQPIVVNEHSPLVIKLLDDYATLSIEELPFELPLIRKIQHHIDSILGSSLPNLTHYRLSTHKHEKVQESLSPCAIPSLLMPKKDG